MQPKHACRMLLCSGAPIISTTASGLEGELKSSMLSQGTESLFWNMELASFTDELVIQSRPSSWAGRELFFCGEQMPFISTESAGSS